MGIKQLSANWSAIEDRIDFSFNTEEGELYRFWLTRAIAKLVLTQNQLLVQEELGNQHNTRASQLIQEFQKESLKKQITFTDVFEGGTITPLGLMPILVCDLVMRLDGDAIAISFTLITNQVVNFRLNSGQLQAWSLLIERLARQAQWAIVEEDQVEIDTTPSGSQPQSLNLH